jgi:hypothetical protein
MNIRDFVDQLDAEQRRTFAELAGTTTNHLLQLKGGHRCASAQLQWNLVKASRRLFKDEPSRWLTLEDVASEAQFNRERRVVVLRRVVKRA